MTRRPAAPPPRAWQRMLSGRRLDLVDPSPLDIEIEDIAHGLSRVARWNGQTSGAHIFSVAQHSLLVEAIAGDAAPDLSARARLYVLLHDAPEYVIGDLISPFKAQLGPGYKAIELRLLAAVHLRFGLAASPPAPVAKFTKAADRTAAWLEAVAIAGFSREEAERTFQPPDGAVGDYRALLASWSADDAKRRFLERFLALDAAR
jgi:hypothetical protein